MTTWQIYQGAEEPHEGIRRLPDPPPWRDFKGELLERTPDPDPNVQKRLGKVFEVGKEEKNLVNAALYLRRPLLVTGKPGTGKSSLAYAVAHELKLGNVLRWPITSRTTLKEGLYEYDAIGRLHEAQRTEEEVDIGRFIHLGPLGTALLPTKYPRVLLIDEIDKSNIDLPNDLLNIFEEGEFEIPELKRIAEAQEEVEVLPHDARDVKDRVPIKGGQVKCHAFPFVVMTSNGERAFPPAFLRRCLILDIPDPDVDKLARIVKSHFDEENIKKRVNYEELIANFIERRDSDGELLATDQLLNAIYLTTQEGIDLDWKSRDIKDLINAVLRNLQTF